MISKEKIKNLPDAPGVYFFKAGREILYVGRASSLRDRVRSYFSVAGRAGRGPLIEKMITAAKSVGFVKTGSVLEALILEAQEIKRLKPRYNTRDKDNKSFWFVAITQEEWPRVLLVRGRDLGGVKAQEVFGPFPLGAEIKEGLKIIRRIFPFRDRCRVPSVRPCFNYELGLCPGVCANLCAREDYLKTVRFLILFFRGRSQTVLRRLKKEMAAAAAAQEFERAQLLKKKIFALTHIQDVALIKAAGVGERAKQFRIEAYDVAHFSGRSAVGAMTVWRDGELDKSSYRRFRLSGNNDLANLTAMLDRRLNHLEWPLPDLVVVDGGAAQINAASRLLFKRQFLMPVVGVVKDEFHRPKKILGDQLLIDRFALAILLLNAEAHRFALRYHRRRRRPLL